MRTTRRRERLAKREAFPRAAALPSSLATITKMWRSSGIKKTDWYGGRFRASTFPTNVVTTADPRDVYSRALSFKNVGTKYTTRKVQLTNPTPLQKPLDSIRRNSFSTTDLPEGIPFTRVRPTLTSEGRSSNSLDCWRVEMVKGPGRGSWRGFRLMRVVANEVECCWWWIASATIASVALSRSIMARWRAQTASWSIVYGAEQLVTSTWQSWWKILCRRHNTHHYIWIIQLSVRYQDGERDAGRSSPRNMDPLQEMHQS